MLISNKDQLSTLLANAAAVLDIPDHVYEDATLKYEDVGSWLEADDSELKHYAPEIYAQGSFRLGTVVRPITEADEYDIDLVCHLNIGKEQTTQANLKKMVGDRLKKREDLSKILIPFRRCWRLDYPPENPKPGFHMDVLPAIPNIERPPTGILLTDTDLRFWQKSNPIAYADWFYERMKAIFHEKRAAFAESIQASVEEIPEWQVKVPLQTVVQILKRHRDLHFQHDQESRPVSIIITTLAARAYLNQVDIYDALAGIVQGIISNWGKQGFVENRNGKYWVVNPVDPEENFADKWNEYPERREAFAKWVQKVRDDFAEVATKSTLNESVSALMPVLGRRTMIKAAQDMGLPVASAQPGITRAQVQVPVLGNTGHCLPLQWPERQSYKASIHGAVYFRQYAKKKLWDLTSRAVPKNVWLRFLAKTNTPFPYDVHWQVVNTGREATEARALRGDFYESEKANHHVRWESTSYSGIHWIEAFIIKSGVCVARSGKKFVKIR